MSVIILFVIRTIRSVLICRSGHSIL
jgi:hypothetical protein